MSSFSHKKRHHYHGFTLLELVLVIVIMGIMAISLANLSTNSVSSYIDGKDRNRLSQSAKWLAERIGREATDALPQSIRTGSSGSFHCLELVKIVNASSYLDMPASGAVSQFNAVTFDLPAASPGYIAVMPINTASVYSLSGGVLAPLGSMTPTGSQVLITLATATDFVGRSPQNRFFLVDQPISFCLNTSNGQMLRYSNYGFQASQPLPPSGSGVLLANNLNASGNVFDYIPGGLSRSALLQINFLSQNRGRNLVGNEESFQVFHEIHIRNAP